MEPVGFDLETAKAGSLFTYGDGFARLAGFTDNDGKPGFLTDMHDMIDVLNAAPWIYGHNVLGFDLLALAFYYGADWDMLSHKTLDTMLLDRLDYPPEARDTGGSVDKYSLDAVCERRGVAGKTDDIRALAVKHGGFDKIPIDDPEYRAYLAGDIDAIKALIDTLPRGDYAKREHRVQSLFGHMTLNGFRVDIPLLNQRIEEGEEHKQEALKILSEDYDLPLGRFEWSGRGKDKVEEWGPFASPLASLEGRQWLIEVWKAFGVSNPPTTDKGRLSTSAEDLRPLAESPFVHDDLARILELMMIVTTTRTVYQTVADHLVGDRVHPMINMGQASGRSSVTSPGLTVMGKRGGRWRERMVFVPEPDHVLISCDLSQVDMRAVAGLCQDTNYMALFENGRDPHEEIAIQLFGDKKFRQEVKPITHGANYGLGQKKLIAQGHDPAKVRRYFDERRQQFPLLMGWQEQIRGQGKSGELLDNGFGRKMRCDPMRAYTQGPALMGQGAAADIMKQALLRLPPEFKPMLKMFVHDEILVSAPKENAEEVRHALKDAMTFEFRGVPIECDVSKAGENWGKVSAK
jgi:DNA polymerase-1